MADSAKDPAGNELCRLLDRVRSARVCVFGDFCLDAYWVIDAAMFEQSAETLLPVQHVREQRYSLGGAGNVLANLAALGVADVRGIGLTGDDLFGWELRRLVGGLDVNAEGLLVRTDWQTCVFGKPHRFGREESRLDFGPFNELCPAAIDELAARLDDAAGRCDVVILNQQLPRGVTTAPMIERINAVVAGHPRTRFIADSRDRADLFRGVILKVNAHEAARLAGRDIARDARIPLLDARKYAQRVGQRTGQPVFVTCGRGGIVVADGSRVLRAGAVPVSGRIDPVGAGDTALAALAAALAVGGGLMAAARLANLAASVTVRKLGMTGVATAEEIIAAAGN